jgi:hypothetical protein
MNDAEAHREIDMNESHRNSQRKMKEEKKCPLPYTPPSALYQPFAPCLGFLDSVVLRRHLLGVISALKLLLGLVE